MTPSPITNITIQQEPCQYHCASDGWLPSDGMVDTILESDTGTASGLFLVPQSDRDYRPCFCNELSSINDDLGDVFV